MEHALRTTSAAASTRTPNATAGSASAWRASWPTSATAGTSCSPRLDGLVREARAGRAAGPAGLDPETEAPFLDVLAAEAGADAGSDAEAEADAEAAERLRDATVELVAHVRREVRLVGFWQNPHAREVLRRWVVQFLDDRDLVPFDRLPAAADRVVALARANHAKLAR